MSLLNPVTDKFRVQLIGAFTDDICEKYNNYLFSKKCTAERHRRKCVRNNRWLYNSRFQFTDKYYHGCFERCIRFKTANTVQHKYHRATECTDVGNL